MGGKCPNTGFYFLSVKQVYFANVRRLTVELSTFCMKAISCQTVFSEHEG